MDAVKFDSLSYDDLSRPASLCPRPQDVHQAQSLRICCRIDCLRRTDSSVPNRWASFYRECVDYGAQLQPSLDISVLTFALTLEHLENAFYTQGLAKYSESDFQKDGLPAWVRGRFVQIAEHESEHVKYLTQALGDLAPQPCEYSL